MSKAQRIADEFIEFLDEYHSQPELFDNALDAQIHRWYADPPKVWPKRPYFSPSASAACPRSLYFKQKRATPDKETKKPYQTRWQNIGTAIGDVIQRDILFAEKHFEKNTGKPPKFVFDKNEDGTPVFEDFAKVNMPIEHRGKTFYLYGTCDGILRYTDEETGEVIRVGLEIKSKQTTAAKTSAYSMKEAESKHIEQASLYADMYGVDFYIILYVNTSKKSWEYPQGEYEKTPDIRAFGYDFSDAELQEGIYDRFVDILEAVENSEPPPLDLDNWTFNNYKTACAQSLTDDEMAELIEQKNQISRSNLPSFKKEGAARAVKDIERLRKEAK